MLCCAVHATWRFKHSSHIVGQNKRLKTRTDSLSTAAISRISATCETASQLGCNDTALSAQAAYQPQGGQEGRRHCQLQRIWPHLFPHYESQAHNFTNNNNNSNCNRNNNKENFNVNYAMLRLPQGSRQRDTRCKFAFTYCLAFPIGALAALALTRIRQWCGKFRRAKKVKSAAWKVGKRWRCQRWAAWLSWADAAVRERGSQRSAVVSLGQTHENKPRRERARNTERVLERRGEWEREAKSGSEWDSDKLRNFWCVCRAKTSSILTKEIALQMKMNQADNWLPALSISRIRKWMSTRRRLNGCH